MARQELPVFDIHYLLGYITLALVLTHVVLNWKVLMTYLKRAAPSATLTEDRRFWRRGVARVAGVAGLATYGAVCFWLGRGQRVERIEILGPGGRAVQGEAAALVDEEARASRPGGSSRPQEKQARPAMIGAFQTIRSDDGDRILADYYHERTKHTRSSVMASGSLDFSTQPAVFKEYPDAPRIALPVPAEKAGLSVAAAIERVRVGEFADPPSRVTLEDLSTILFMTNGITEVRRYPGRTLHLRAAPSAGALYPTVTYLVVRDVEGLAAGLYHYVVTDHALERLREGGDVSEEAAALVARPWEVEEAPAALFFTSLFFRSCWKYGERAYRYCLLDAGHLAVQAQLAAAARGFFAPLTVRFDDREAAALLDLDDREEAPMMIMPVGVPAGAGEDVRLEQELRLDPLEREVRRFPLAHLMHDRTAMALTGEMVASFPPRGPDDARPAVGAIPLPGVDLEGHDLFTAIRARRSMREWASPAMSREDFAALLQAAFGMSATRRQPDPSPARNHALRLYVLVNDVSGIKPGAYAYLRAEGALAPLHPGDMRSREFGASLLQEVVRDAQFNVVMTIDLERLGFPDGDRGYRYAGLEAGMLGGRLYLQAVARGLGCCGIGAYFDDEVSDLIGVSASRELVIYMASLGLK